MLDESVAWIKRTILIQPPAEQKDPPKIHEYNTKEDKWLKFKTSVILEETNTEYFGFQSSRSFLLFTSLASLYF